MSLPLQGSKPPTAVAIVTPQRSNSLDFLNFEEKRQIIASSLSLTDFLQNKHAQGSTTTPTSPNTAKFILGELASKFFLPRYAGKRENPTGKFCLYQFVIA